MASTRLIDELLAGDIMPSRGGIEPRPGRPVCSTTAVEGASAGDYEIFEQLIGIDSGLPPGWMARVALINERRVVSFAAWESLERGREFFAGVVAERLPKLAHVEIPRRDFVRHEYRLLGLIPGFRAGDLVAGCRGAPEEAVAYVMGVRFAIDEEAGRTMRDAVHRIGLIGRSQTMARLRETSLMLEIGCVTADGILIAYVHADPVAAATFFDHTVREIADDAYADWPVPAIEIERYDVLRATIAESVLMG